MIVKVGELPSNGGRRTHVLKLNGEAAFFVTVDLEGPASGLLSPTSRGRAVPLGRGHRARWTTRCQQDHACLWFYEAESATVDGSRPREVTDTHLRLLPGTKQVSIHGMRRPQMADMIHQQAVEE